MGPTAASCPTCGGLIEVSLPSVVAPRGSKDNTNKIEIVLPDGRVVGSVEVPAQMVERDAQADSTMRMETSSMDRSARMVNGGQRIGSAVTDITLMSLSQGAITKLNEPLVICLETDEKSAVSKKDMCLGYYNEDKSEWECEDRCVKEKDNTFCGSTGHLTSFALLLGGGGNQRKCDNQMDETIMWTSVGFAAGALVIVALSVVIIEVSVRVRSHKQARFLRGLGKQSHTPL